MVKHKVYIVLSIKTLTPFYVKSAFFLSKAGKRHLRMDRIIKEKISADHLLYVSLKYTKTSEVIVNLILRWTTMMDYSFERMLQHAKKKKMIKLIPNSPKPKIDLLKEIFKNKKEVMDTIELYDMFRRIDELKKESEGEFRKNVALKVYYRGDIIKVNLDKLKEYSIILEKFINYLKQFLSS
ncbi:hypothetical protein J4205_00700 [Candidatus Pacearchaeota archaeon]|nr:hypothetical protein [Candidatus Pacearchaeota archaeon]